MPCWQAHKVYHFLRTEAVSKNIATVKMALTQVLLVLREYYQRRFLTPILAKLTFLIITYVGRKQIKLSLSVLLKPNFAHKISFLSW